MSEQNRKDSIFPIQFLLLFAQPRSTPAMFSFIFHATRTHDKRNVTFYKEHTTLFSLSDKLIYHSQAVDIRSETETAPDQGGEHNFASICIHSNISHVILTSHVTLAHKSSSSSLMQLLIKKFFGYI